MICSTAVWSERRLGSLQYRGRYWIRHHGLPGLLPPRYFVLVARDRPLSKIAGGSVSCFGQRREAWSPVECTHPPSIRAVQAPEYLRGDAAGFTVRENLFQRQGRFERLLSVQFLTDRAMTPTKSRFVTSGQKGRPEPPFLRHSGPGELRFRGSRSARWWPGRDSQSLR